MIESSCIISTLLVSTALRSAHVMEWGAVESTYEVFLSLVRSSLRLLYDAKSLCSCGASVTDAKMSSFDSYTEYIRSLSLRWPEFRWLLDYLCSPNTPRKCYTTFVDVGNKDIDTETFSSVTDGFRHRLQQSISHLKNRLVIVHYVDIQTVDRSMLDSIGLHYDIDPVFYWHHFDTSEAQDSKDSKFKAPLLPSKAISLELSHLEYEHASVIFERNIESSDGPYTSTSAICVVLEI